MRFTPTQLEENAYRETENLLLVIQDVSKRDFSDGFEGNRKVYPRGSEEYVVIRGPSTDSFHSNANRRECLLRDGEHAIRLSRWLQARAFDDCFQEIEMPICDAVKKYSLE